MHNDIFQIQTHDPLILFHAWLKDAQEKEISDPTAMAVACVDAQGHPSVRVVLMRQADEKGFAFFTNYNSQKGQALLANPYAEANFHWKSIERQVRISGPVEKTSAAESDAYFASRHRNSQIGAWASQQSTAMSSYEVLEQTYEHYDTLYKEQKEIPRPPNWGGFRIKPERMEFWLAHPHRLHKRFVFEKTKGQWQGRWLFP